MQRFADAVIEDLKPLNAPDDDGCRLQCERAAVIKRLNDAAVPVVGIPLFPAAEGYYFTGNDRENRGEELPSRAGLNMVSVEPLRAACARKLLLPECAVSE
jgi:hypothetical protein